MCRHAAYIGPDIAASSLFSELDHGLLHQSYAPRELLSGVVCADGYGAGWYQDAHAARYAFAGPVWSDRNLETMLPLVRSPLVMAAVRNGTVAGANIEANCAPFVQGRYLGSLNGALEDFETRWRDWLLAQWDVPAAAMRGSTDGEVVFHAIASAAQSHDGPGALATATQEICRQLIERGRQEGLDVQLNLLLSDGEQIVATRAGLGTQNSLYLLKDGDEFPGGLLVASEPLYDDPGWEPVAPDSVLALRAGAPPVRLVV